MLCYVWNRLEEKETVHISRNDEKDIYNLLARVLISRLKILIRRGYYKEYISEEEETGTIRGRINFPQSLNKLSFKQARMYCEFDELSHDILHNQIIKTTLYYLLRLPLVNKNIRADIQKIYPYFQEIKTIHLTNRVFYQVKIHRTNQQYGFLIDICKFLYDSLLISDEDTAKEKFTAFNQNTPELAYLFEDFVRNFYKKELTNSKVSREDLYWDASGDDLSYLPKMQTDISIEVNNKKIIMDTKFYRNTLSDNYNSEKLISNNLYQVFAYINNSKSKYDKKTTGILLYPKVDKDLDLSYTMSGYPMKVFTVDMNEEWQSIHERLIEIVSV